jgi:hypothetical protein
MGAPSEFAPVLAAVAKAAAGDWPEHAVADLAALMVLGMDVELASLSPEAGAAMDRFFRRAGLDDAEDPNAALAAYLRRHPIPAALLASVGAAARSGLIERASKLSGKALAALGRKPALRPVQGCAADASSLLQLRLRGIRNA